MTSGSQALGQRERLGAIRRLADDLEVRVAGEHAAQAVADDRMVVDDQEPDRAHARGVADAAPAAIAGTRAETAVPPPGSDSIASGARDPGHPLAHPVQPEAGRRGAGSGRRTSNPTPSSRTSSVTTSPMNDSVSRRAAARGVLRDVGQGLLGGPQQRDLDLGVEGDGLAGRR